MRHLCPKLSALIYTKHIGCSLTFSLYLKSNYLLKQHYANHHFSPNLIALVDSESITMDNEEKKKGFKLAELNKDVSAPLLSLEKYNPEHSTGTSCSVAIANKMVPLQIQEACT